MTLILQALKEKVELLSQMIVVALNWQIIAVKSTEVVVFKAQHEFVPHEISIIHQWVKKSTQNELCCVLCYGAIYVWSSLFNTQNNKTDFVFNSLDWEVRHWYIHRCKLTKKTRTSHFCTDCNKNKSIWLVTNSLVWFLQFEV